MSKLTIGICGGGVGGLCAAIALRKLGHEVRVYGKRPAITPCQQ